MSLIRYETHGFSTPVKPPASGALPVSLAELIWGAITVGATPLSMGGTPRPLIELSWRAAMAASSVEEESNSGQWTKTKSYIRIDPSEKRAVSYFLGMIQAKITCAKLLQAPHLIHLDAYLAMIGKSTNRSRPDLIGVDLPSMDCTIAVEAKGLSDGWRRAVAKKAKGQASSLPAILGTSKTIHVASVAYFGRRNRWKAYLEDPPSSPRPSSDSMRSGTALAAYYRPLVASAIEAGGEQVDEDDAMTIARIPGIDLILGVPTTIVDIMQELPTTGAVSRSLLDDVGPALLRTVRERSANMRLPSPEDWAGGEDTLPSPNDRRYTGLDGIYLELGQTWE